MTTLYTIALERKGAPVWWAFELYRGSSLLTSFEERAALFNEQDVRKLMECSVAIKSGWRAKIRVATAEQIRRNSPESAA